MTGTLQNQKTFFSMGTVNTITVSEKSDEALAAAKERVKKIESKLSATSPDSEISVINKNAGVCPTTVSPETLKLIKRSLKYSELTDGRFDMSAGPLTMLWNKALEDGILPEFDEVIKAKNLVDYRDIILDEEKRTVMLRNKGQRLDTGAVAKGYAADEVRKLLESYGMHDAIINVGGVLINMGTSQEIGIQKPFAPEGHYFASLDLPEGKAVVSSRNYDHTRIIDDHLVHRIADVRTGLPSKSGVISATLIGDSAEELDAFAAASMVYGAEQSIKFLESRNIDAVFITDERKVYITENLADRIKIKKSLPLLSRRYHLCR
ncbi:MAG: FAD:protein FMN transferase [Oscillospiraceae bacterium]|nr:FAD:protein FMN transferase [Oscillospiraceae bacterium]